ncbi:MAG: hypothetical protein IT243_06520 [Bacteroidia bacterium]|nr:hypothetical protein [Bacteroidia bacterium]
MKFIAGKNRNQLKFLCLEQAVDAFCDVRLIDLFVAGLDLAKYWFK